MTNPIPSGDHAPGHTLGGHPGGEPFFNTHGGEHASQWSGNPAPPYDATPPYQPYPPQYQPYYPAGAAPYPGYPQQYTPGMNPTNPFAIASLIVSLVGFGLIGVILGHVALGQIKRSNGYEHGRGLAIAGLIIGYAQIAIVLLFALGFLLLVVFVTPTTPATFPSN